MKKILRSIAKWAGVTTTYHVAATYSISKTSQAWASQTVTISPWLHRDNYPDLVKYLAEELDIASTPPSITSITRIGS